MQLQAGRGQGGAGGLKNFPEGQPGTGETRRWESESQLCGSLPGGLGQVTPSEPQCPLPSDRGGGICLVGLD